jgi:hypothetical protein
MVLAAMVGDGYVTPGQAALAAAAPVIDTPSTGC